MDNKKLTDILAHPLAAAVLTATLVVTLVGCNFGTSEYQPYENAAGAKECEVGLTSFKTNIAAGTAGCNCHQSGTPPRLTKGADADNRKALLKTQRDYAYLSGGHTGASAFRAGISQQQWDTWQADEKKCP